VKNIRSRRILRFLILSVSILTIFGCAVKHEGTITILHTNDMHSQYVPVPATWVQKDPKPLIGGMVALDYFIQQQRKSYANSLLLDGGDIMTGTPLSLIQVDGALGGGFVKMMNLIGYDAMTIGNHEFDAGQENLKKLLTLPKFDVLSANLYRNDSLVAPKPYAIYKVGSLRVGVIGLILGNLVEVAARKNLQGIRVDDPTQTAQKYIDEIDAKTDLILLLAHQGVEADLKMADRLHHADVIVGAHSHTRLNEVIKRNRMLVVQAGSITSYLGKLMVEVKADTVANYQYELIPTWVDEVKEPNAQMLQLVDAYKKQIDEQYGEVIGTLKTEWKKDNRAESNIGNYMTDVIRATTGADFALLNSGGIRKSLPAGSITKLNIVEILPFANYLVTFECTGEQLKSLVLENAVASVKGAHGILQVSGLTYRYRVDRDNNVTIASAQVAGKEINPKGVYRGATVDFVMEGLIEKHPDLAAKEPEVTGQILSDAVIEFIKRHPQVDSRVEGRMKKVR